MEKGHTSVTTGAGSEPPNSPRAHPPPYKIQHGNTVRLHGHHITE